MLLRSLLAVPFLCCAQIVHTRLLTQQDTNGNSILGTLAAPLLEPLEDSTWGSRSIEDSNVYGDPPPGGVTRRYTFNITRSFLAPDGVNTSMTVVNGAYPGPTIQANWGDTFEVTVYNHISGAVGGTSIHWHGLLQRDTPFMDGVPSVTQCPIAPGESFVYTFKADRPGTSWWHSHYEAQTTAGLHGAMIIHGPAQAGADYDFDLGPVLLSDRYHIDYVQLLQGYTSVPLDLIFSDSNLINGKGVYDCSQTNLTCFPNAGYAQFRFQSGKRHLLRLINSSAEGLQHFTIDNHNFTVIWLDFVPIEPFKTSMISLSPGQRANIIVHANGEPTDVVWMRSDIDSVCAAPNNPHTRAIILYESADTTSIPTTSATPYNATDCVTQDLNSTTPTYGLALSNSVPKRIDLNFTLGYNGTGFLQWYTSNQTFRADMSQSLLARAAAGDFTFKTENPLWNVYDIGSNGTVRVLMRNYHISPHPMHLHGHDFWVLAEGRGEWDGSIINAGNPMRRDTHQLLPMRNNVPGFAVIEWTLDNPGIWAFHCHIFSHSSLGFYLNVLEASQDIVGRDVPDDVKQSCTSWNAFTAKTFVDQPDAGI